MTGDEAIAALDLPAAALVDRRVPKTLLVEHGARTAADKRHIISGIEEIRWVAALKPTTIGVAAYHDEGREYREIAILQATFRSATKAPRLIELLHRAIPYPVVAVSEQGDRVNLSFAHKRWSHGEVGKTVLEERPVAVDCPRDGARHAGEFMTALGLGRQPQASLLALYQGWIDVSLALEASRRTGRFEILDVPERLAARREALRECGRLDAEISHIRTLAAREKQLARQVDLNLELKRAEAAHEAALALL